MGDRTISVVIGIDDGFAIPALVMLRSACQHLSPGWELDVFILGYRISPASRHQISQGLGDCPVRLQWREPDLGGVRKRLPGIRRDADVTVYFRLLIGEELPESVKCVIFLDVDILVRGDLAELWNRPFAGHVIQAVPDAYADTLHLPRFRKIAETLSLPLSHEAQYFNAGVQFVDLQAWRSENIGRQAMEFLVAHGEHLKERDQDALNCILVDRWNPLPATWNLHELPHCLFLWRSGRAAEDESQPAFENPKVIHFIGPRKPWHGDSTHIYQREWRQLAIEAGVEPQLEPLLRSLWHRLIRVPHAQLNWHVWKHVPRAPHTERWLGIGTILMSHPWMVFTYPPWQAKVWMDYHVRRPLRLWVWERIDSWRG